MSGATASSRWVPRIGWTLIVLVFVAFVWGLGRRSRLDAVGEELVRMLFVPSVEQGTLVRRGDDLARFVREDSGLVLKTEVPTSYAAVIQALGSGQADVAWMPAFAYVIAHARYDAEARLQVVRSADLFGIVVTRDRAREPERLDQLAGRRVAVPESLDAKLRALLTGELDRLAPGWVEVPSASDAQAVRALVTPGSEVAAALSSHVPSGANDFVGDGRKELEYERPGTLLETRVIYTTETPVEVLKNYYHGCVYARTDSRVRRLEDLNGARFAFSDETSTSGHIFPRMLLDRKGVTLGRVYYAGGHPNVVQAVWDGKADGGAAFYSPPNDQQRREGVLVGDARYLITRRMNDQAARQALVDDVRVLALSDPIPNDLCAVRAGFPEHIWQRFLASFDRFLETDLGKAAFFDLLAAVGVGRTDDSGYDGFRAALATAEVSAEGLLQAEEAKLEGRKGSGS